MLGWGYQPRNRTHIMWLLNCRADMQHQLVGLAGHVWPCVTSRAMLVLSEVYQPHRAHLERGLPTALGKPHRGGDFVDVEADHSFAQALRDFGEHLGVVVVGGGFNDGLGALGRVTRLEDA